jgi:hypothetical protein
MSLIERAHVASLLHQGDTAATAKAKGDALEELICHIFGAISGITVTRRNKFNAFDTEEIDVAFFNDQANGDLPFLPWIILVECKNWRAPVGSEQVSWFDTKLRNRGLEFGILVATNGITGDSTVLSDAHLIIARALQEKRKLIVLTRDELLKLTDSSELVHVIKEKLCELAVSGRIG